MHYISIIFVLFASAVFATDASRQEYLELVQRIPKLVQPCGDYTKGEIQIVLDPQEMAAIEKAASRDVGVIKQDKYWLWINDAVIFPSGHKGVYGRILWSKSLDKCPDVAVLPVMPDGKFVLNCNFRHATRSWEIELPRGLVEPGEKQEDAARREALEETGMVVESLELLGEMPPDSGLTGAIVSVYLADVVKRQNPEREESEAIEEIVLLDEQEIKQAFSKGYLECIIRGVPKIVLVRDPFLAFALLKYDLKPNP